MSRTHFLWAGLSALIPALACPQTALDDCSAQFINADVSNAPTLFSSPSDQPFGSNQHLCYQDDGVSFFASEYWPEEFAPRWVAYRLSPDNYGVDGCATYTRGTANCYIQKDTWAEFLACMPASSDPFHRDHMLIGERLATGDFGSTGHDRGHIAPRQAFSWHVCGTYQTFTMANMSPQRAFLNQDIWRILEEQVLSWAIEEGPLFVVSGTTFRAFPHQRFQVYTDGVLDSAQTYTSGFRMQEAVDQHAMNFDSTITDDILRPKRDANPTNISTRAVSVRMPTGYFKVIYRPATATETEHAIGFMLPHSFENLNMLSESYVNLTEAEAFWAFVSRIDLIEETSGVRFPGIPNNIKDIWGDDFFFDRAGLGEIRASTCGIGTPQGVIVDSTGDERLAACIDHL